MSRQCRDSVLVPVALCSTVDRCVGAAATRSWPIPDQIRKPPRPPTSAIPQPPGMAWASSRTPTRRTCSSPYGSTYARRSTWQRNRTDWARSRPDGPGTSRCWPTRWHCQPRRRRGYRAPRRHRPASAPTTAIAEAVDHPLARPPATFAAVSRPPEPDHGRELRPIDGTEVAVLGPDRHGGAENPVRVLLCSEPPTPSCSPSATAAKRRGGGPQPKRI